MTKTHSSLRRGLTPIRALLASILLLAIVLVRPTGVVSAHTSFEQSTPTDGATLSEPLGVIIVEFSGVSEPAGDGFTVLTPHGQVRTPTGVSTTDQQTFELTFDPPLAGGEVGVRWSVNAPDAHPIDGAFSFTVTAPTASSTEATDASQAAGPDAVEPSLDRAADDRTGVTVMADGSATDTSSTSTSLDEFLAASPARSGQGTARWGRLIEFAALTLLIGGAAFAATTLRGRRAEIDHAITILRVLGLTLAAGALLEYVGVARLAQASIASHWTSQPGMATLLRGAGGLAVAAGLAAITMPVRAPRPAHSLSAAVNSTTQYEREERIRFWPDDDQQHQRARPDRHTMHRAERSPAVGTTTIDPLLHRHDQRTTLAPSVERQSITISTTPPLRHTRPVERRREPASRSSDDTHTDSPVIRRWVLDRSSTAAFVGVAVAVMSFWFDGHTVSKGLRPLHAIVNSIHVIAGSIWLGGVVAMAIVLWSRHRTGVAPRALEMIVRFSGIATVALGAVLAAGGIMTILVLDSVGELFSTQWGQVLLLKSAAVALAMTGGAYNHFRLLPALEADPDDPHLVEQLRSAVTAEAILLSFVIVVTTSLVAAAS